MSQTEAPDPRPAAGSLTIRPLRDRWLRSDVGALVALYNRSLTDVHGFVPITEARFRRRVLGSPHFQPDLCLLALRGGTLAGVLHAAALREPCHEAGGVVSLVMVAPEHRRRGVGGALLDAALAVLRRRGVPVVDGGGSFPFSPFYATLLDGSERSGPDLANAGALGLFASRGFLRARESTIMRADLAAAAVPAAAETDGEARLRIRRRAPEATWLDHCFRGWTLHDSRLVTPGSERLLSRAIFGRMPDLSAQEGRELYALFGVQTPLPLRGQGWAGRHFRQLLAHLRDRGAEAVELHVYSDNEPAVRLYRASGFVDVGRTMMCRLPLREGA